jgi:peptidoglycan/xylan/chitin deacetylase (PgdA/CDA1 family)
MKAITLLYHDVIANGDFDSSGFPGLVPATYKLEVTEFRQHLAAVAEALGAQPATVFDLINDQAPDPPFFITFDDGGASAHSHIADLLESMGWYAHFFVTTDYIGTASFLTKGQIRELRSRGHVIGSHSCSHPTRMAACSWQQLVHEWGKSTTILSDLLSEPVTAASVPGGYYTRKVARAAASVGIKALFTSEPTLRCNYVDRCLVLGRYSLRRGASPQLAAALAARQLVPRLRQAIFWKAKKVAKLVGGPVYLSLRRRIVK